MPDKVLQVTIAEELLEELHALKGTGSIQELLNNAISLFQWAKEETDKGFSIGSLNRDAEFSSLVMSCFKKL